MGGGQGQTILMGQDHVLSTSCQPCLHFTHNQAARTQPTCDMRHFASLVLAQYLALHKRAPESHLLAQIVQRSQRQSGRCSHSLHNHYSRANGSAYAQGTTQRARDGKSLAAGAVPWSTKLQSGFWAQEEPGRPCPTARRSVRGNPLPPQGWSEE